MLAARRLRGLSEAEGCRAQQLLLRRLRRRLGAAAPAGGCPAGAGLELGNDASPLVGGAVCSPRGGAGRARCGPPAGPAWSALAAAEPGESPAAEAGDGTGRRVPGCCSPCRAAEQPGVFQEAGQGGQVGRVLSRRCECSCDISPQRRARCRARGVCRWRWPCACCWACGSVSERPRTASAPSLGLPPPSTSRLPAAPPAPMAPRGSTAATTRP